MSLDEDSLSGHAFIIGATGSGKTTLLVYLIKYIRENISDASVIFIDPHGDASVQVASLVPNPVLYDPILAPFALNPMDLGEYSGERVLMVQRRVAELVNVLNELFGVEQSRAPRLLWIFRGLLYYLYSVSDTPTFLDLYALLTELLADPSEIRTLMKASGLDDELVKKTIEAISGLDPQAFTAVLNRISGFVIPAGSLTSKTFNTRKTTVDWNGMLSPQGITIFRIPRHALPD
ncbi:MAG: helicase HerA domain-containing protein, partial [Nitrososphaeria archaeon]